MVEVALEEEAELDSELLELDGDDDVDVEELLVGLVELLL